jgi:cytoskeletal protein RodZ
MNPAAVDSKIIDPHADSIDNSSNSRNDLAVVASVLVSAVLVILIALIVWKRKRNGLAKEKEDSLNRPHVNKISRASSVSTGTETDVENSLNQPHPKTSGTASSLISWRRDSLANEKLETDLENSLKTSRAASSLIFWKRESNGLAKEKEETENSLNQPTEKKSTRDSLASTVTTGTWISMFKFYE